MEKEKETQIRVKIKAEQNLMDWMTEYFGDIICDEAEVFKSIALYHGVILKVHQFSRYTDGADPDYIIFELTPKKATAIDFKFGASRVADMIFALFDCCDEACKVEVWEEDPQSDQYVRIRVDGHYHS
jgi:hypothetical protein